MFCDFSSLKELNFNNFNTNNVYVNNILFGCSIELIEQIKMKYKNISESAFPNYY